MFHSLFAVCQKLQAGTVLLIDITWDEVWPRMIQMINGLNVPYIRLDVTIRPFARTFFKYLQYTETYDVAMIFQNEKGLNHFRMATGPLFMSCITLI